LFDFLPALVLYELCLESRKAKVMNISRKEKLKYRPIPLATIAFQKLVSSKLKIDSDKAMSIAEKLYQKGLISYPRTETDSFKSTINLRQLTEIHNNHED
jgi:Topoisomerase IA